MLSRLVALLLFFASLGSTAQTFKWATSVGQWTIDEVESTLYDSDGSLYVTGYVSSGATFEDVVADHRGSFLAKYDPSGGLLWVRFGSSFNSARGSSLAIDNSGNVYVGGIFTSGITFEDVTLTGAAQSKVFLVKYSRDGDLLWVKQQGSNHLSSWDGWVRVAVDGHDNVYITGRYSRQYQLDGNIVLTDAFPDSWPDYDVFLVKYNAQGEIQWATSASAPHGDDLITGFAIDNDNKIFLSLQTGSREFKYGDQETQELDVETTGGAVLLTIDADGNLLHILTLHARITSFAIDEDRIVMSGTYIDKLELGDGYELTADNEDGFLARLNSNDKPDLLRSVPEGGFLLAVHHGNIYGARFFSRHFEIDDIVVSAGRHGGLVAKFNEVGYTQWVKAIEIVNGRVSSITVSNEDAIAVAGEYEARQIDFDGILVNNNSGNDDEDIFVGVIDDHTPERCPPINPALSPLNVVICDNEMVPLQPSGVSNTPVTWYKDGEAIEETGPVPMNAVATGEYYFKVYANTVCADSSNHVHIRKLDTPDSTISAYPSEEICNGEPVTLRVEAVSGFTYQWFKDGLMIAGENDSDLITETSADYKVVIANEGLCFSGNSIQVTILPAEPDFLPDTIFHCADEVVTLLPDLHYPHWQFRWSTSEFADSIAVVSDGIYALEVFSDRCSTTDSVRIVTYDKIWAPNVITPNGDGLNDTFVVLNDIGSISVNVYNRWGGKVFSTPDYQNNWSADGLMPGVYFYHVVDLACHPGEALKGWVHVIK